MDFIERLFGIAPDGGSGALEILLALLPLAIFLVASSVGYRVRGRR